MSIFDGIEKRYEQANGGLKSVEVPEWEGRVYYRDFIPTADALQILKYVQPDTGDFDLEGLVLALMLSARNEDGSRMFMAQHKDLLMNKTEVEVILRVVTQMGIMDRLIGGSVEKKT